MLCSNWRGMWRTEPLKFQYILHTLNADTNNYFALHWSYLSNLSLGVRLKPWVWMTAKWRIFTLQSSKWEARKGEGRQQNGQINEFSFLILAVMEKLPSCKSVLSEQKTFSKVFHQCQLYTYLDSNQEACCNIKVSNIHFPNVFYLAEDFSD